MVTKPTGNRRGRPSIPLADDPDRYQLAAMQAFMKAGASQRQAIDLSVAVFQCNEVEPSKPHLRSRRAIGIKPIGYQIVSRPGAPATFDGRYSSLLQKAKRARSVDEEAWLGAMSAAFATALFASDVADATEVVRALAILSNEQSYAERVLIPTLISRFPAPA